MDEKYARMTKNHAHDENKRMMKNNAYNENLCAQVIRLPGFHHVLDGLALADFFVQHLARQRRKLRVASKTQRNQLAHRELPDARLQVRRQRPLVAQPLFQPNDAVLHLQRHPPRAEESYRQARRQQHPLGSLPRKSRRIPPVNRPDKIDGHHRHDEKVKLRKKFPVIREILVTHVDPSLSPRDCSKVRRARSDFSTILLLSVSRYYLLR